jgi:23S rRNA (uracil1939-C5)-methyltransferase
MQKFQKVDLTIHGFGSSGEGVGSLDGYTVFVDGALPGEVVHVKLTECKARYAKAELLEIVQSSKDRVQPVCPLFGRCGGCQIMHLSYEKQLEMKRQRVVDALSRIGHMEDCTVLPCLPSPKPLHYRNKIQMPVKLGKNGIEIGLYAKNSNELVAVETCYIHASLGQEVYEKVRPIIQKGVGEKDLRHLIIKTAVSLGEVLIILVTDRPPTPLILDLARKLIAAHPAIRGVVHNLHQGKENVILGKTFTVMEGQGSIEERLCEKALNFKVSPASFFQVNPEQAERLYQTALQLADLQGDEVVLDAYCGVGTLSLIFAQKAKKVIGVECVASAIEDARENGKRNGIQNVSFVCMESEKYIGSSPKFDVVILNPPRKGCDPALLETLTQKAPKKIIYISCDPATLARDLAAIRKNGYTIEEVQPFDMFPQTAHVESVVLARHL